MAASLAGAPQWFIARGPIWFDSATAGGSNESAFVAENGASAGPFSFASVGWTISGGPTTTTPVLITVNGVTGYFPFNVLTTMPTGFKNSVAQGSVWTIA